MRRVERLCLLAGLPLVTLLPVELAGQAPLPEGGPRVHEPRTTVPAITAADLTTRLYILADDSMQGREAGTTGNVRGTDYIARELKRLGLAPGGENGTYFQTIPLKTRAFDETSTFAVAGARLTAFTDYVALDPRAIQSPSLPIVYGGQASDAAQPLAAEQAAGKLVVLSVPPGVRGREVAGHRHRTEQQHLRRTLRGESGTHSDVHRVARSGPPQRVHRDVPRRLRSRRVGPVGPSGRLGDDVPVGVGDVDDLATG